MPGSFSRRVDRSRKEKRRRIVGPKEEGDDNNRSAINAQVSRAAGGKRKGVSGEAKKEKAGDNLNFPERLMQLINENIVPDHVSWIESEEAIAFKTEGLQMTVLDKYFKGLKYDSFIRKLNR